LGLLEPTWVSCWDPPPFRDFGTVKGYNDTTIQQFKNYLAAKYGAIENLNQHWNTSYPSFDSITQSHIASWNEPSIRMAEWNYFRSRRFGELIESLKDLIISKCNTPICFYLDFNWIGPGDWTGGQGSHTRRLSYQQKAADLIVMRSFAYTWKQVDQVLRWCRYFKRSGTGGNAKVFLQQALVDRDGQAGIQYAPLEQRLPEGETPETFIVKTRDFYLSGGIDLVGIYGWCEAMESCLYKYGNSAARRSLAQALDDRSAYVPYSPAEIGFLLPEGIMLQRLMTNIDHRFVEDALAFISYNGGSEKNYLDFQQGWQQFNLATVHRPLSPHDEVLKLQGTSNGGVSYLHDLRTLMAI